MPGSPDPVFRNEALTGAIAVAIAVGIVHVVINVHRISEGSLLVVLGVAQLYGLGLVGAWFAVQLWVYGRGLPPDVGQVPIDTEDLLVTLGVGLFALNAQAAVPLYLYATWSLVGPIAAWFAGTAAAVFTIAHVGGESPGLFIYSVLGVPAVVAISVVAALLEVALHVLA